jgi:hypothetical protein
MQSSLNRFARIDAPRRLGRSVGGTSGYRGVVALWGVVAGLASLAFVVYLLPVGNYQSVRIPLRPQILSDVEALAKELSLTRDDLLRRIVADWVIARKPIVEQSKIRNARDAFGAAGDRANLVQAWIEFMRRQRKSTPKDVATDRFLKRMYLRCNVKVSRSTLYNWHRRLDAEGISGLIDGRLVDHAARRNVYLFFRELKRIHIFAAKGTSLKRSYEETCRVAEKRGWPLPRLLAAKRYMNAV